MSAPWDWYISYGLLFSIFVWCFMKKARSTTTKIELFLLLILQCWDPKCTFLLYTLAKFIQSLLVFFFRYVMGTYKNGELVYYLLGFREDPVHAGFLYRNVFYHYTLARRGFRNQKGDRLTNLVPDHSENVPTAKWKQPVAYDAGSFEDSELEQLLASSGKCHNWALVTLYQISSDKFFTYGLLAILRWETWILWLALLISCARGEDLGYLVEPFLLGLFLYDTFNLNSVLAEKGQIYRNTRKMSVRSEAAKFLMLCIISAFVWSSIGVWGASSQYFLLLALTFIVALSMWCFFPTVPLKTA
jgi:hypothetical protein